MTKRIIHIILIVLLTISISLFSYVLIKNITIEKSILSLKEKKNNIVNNNNHLKNENEELNNQLSSLENELKDKISEYEVWKETKKKIETIIG